jgi:hypothetical protein
MSIQKSGLSKIQKELLELFPNDVSEEELFEIKLLLSHYFAEKATNAMDKFLDENGIDEAELIRWSYEHNRREGGK